MTTTGYSNYKLNGYPLQTLGWNIDKLDGIDGMPEKRGANLATPYHDGDYSFDDKFYGSRSFAIRMLVFPQDENGNVNPIEGGAFNLRENLDFLKGLFTANRGLQTFSFEVRDGQGGAVEREIGVEVLAPFDIAESKKHGLQFTIELVAPRPFWRDSDSKRLEVIGDNYTSFSLNIGGNAPEGEAVIGFKSLQGGSNPSIECTTSGDRVWVSDVASTHDEYVLDFGKRLFTKNGLRADSLITRRTPQFMRIPAQTAWMIFRSSTGTWDVTIDYHRKWL